MSAQDIINICEAVWPQDKSDCSAFVRDVASRLKIVLTGDANDIVDAIRGAAWRSLADGVAAKAAADAGDFVVAGMKGADQSIPSAHGHVVVVVKGDLDSTHGKYPTAYWGKLGSVGMRKTTLNYAWREADRDRVTYAAKTPAA